MKDLQIFNSEEFGSVRTLIGQNGEPWFVGKDVANALGYKNANDAISKHVDLEDKGVAKRDTLGGSQNMIIINESGMYALVLSSQLPGAKRFKKWVTSEVLPSIRRHGMYAVEDILNNPDAAIEVLYQIKKERAEKEQLRMENAVKDQQIAELQPKATYYDLVLSCRDFLPITVIAKDYGWSGKHMNAWLHEQGIQYLQKNGVWILYQKFADKGYTSTKTFTVEDRDGNLHSGVHTYWTQAGRLFIYDRMKEDGHLPLIEQIGKIVSKTY